TEKTIDLPHPVGIALGEVVVDGDDVNTLSRQRIEVDRQRRDQPLAFTGFHLGDIALVKHHTTDKLHVEVALSERPLGRFAYRRKRLNEDIVQCGAVLEAFAKTGGASAQIGIGKFFYFHFQGIDGGNLGTETLDPALVGGAKDLGGQTTDRKHVVCPNRL